MTGFQKSRRSLKKVTGAEHLMIKASKPLDEDELAALKEANEALELIIKVTVPEYVPPAVKLRTRIDERLFTALADAKFLEALEDDENVDSIAVSKPLRIID